MVHALEVVTVQDVIVVPTNDEYWGKIGFLIMNSVLVEYEEESVPRTPENPKRMLIENRYLGEMQIQELNKEDPAGLVDCAGQL